MIIQERARSVTRFEHVVVLSTRIVLHEIVEAVSSRVGAVHTGDEEKEPVDSKHYKELVVGDGKRRG